jgi:hypothetical protein
VSAIDPSWFDVSRSGLAMLLERRGGPGGGKVWMLHELISNAWDADQVTRVDVTLEPASRVLTRVTVSDDAPDGFADLRHAWTVFAESTRKGDPSKRGRFDLGEKTALALCDE